MGNLVCLLFFLWMRTWEAGVIWITDHLTSPWKRAAAAFCSLFPCSVAEILIVLAFLLGLFLIGFSVGAFLKKTNRLFAFYQRILALFCCVFTIYNGFCLLWGFHYYTPSFSEQSGITAAPASVETLTQTAKYFAGKLNETDPLIQRDEKLLFAEDIDQIYAESTQIYQNITDEFPFLSGKEYTPKRIFFSSILSDLSFTGFFFPFTGESNINDDSPSCFVPSTIAHELAHQKGIASEQEANFIAILVCDRSDIPVYQYAGALLAYVYLSNALSQYDPDLANDIYQNLPQGVKADLANNNAYWAAHQNIVTEVSNQVYDRFLKSYDQELGLLTYGTVVDLLIAYYR